MPMTFTSFVVFAEMRTGSNLLEASINRLAGATCHGEAFNPALIGYPGRDEMLGMTKAARDADPLALLARIHGAPGLNGFRYFHDHDPRIFATVLDDPACAKIVLTRNPLDSFVSLGIARATGQWKLGDARHRRAGQVRFDKAAFEAHLERLQGFQLRLLRALQTRGQTAFHLAYEDLRELDVLNGLAAWLGLDGRLDALPRDLVPQNPEPLERKVVNFAEMEASLARLDRFDLSRTPNFEPRRGANVPLMMAAAGAPLLYMPLRPDPEEVLRPWLAGLGSPAGLVEGFTQKTLRQWLRANPGHRSFTVVRHPVERAFAAFAGAILNGRYTEIRSQLSERYHLDLPPPVKVGGMTPAALHEAFVGFLHFVAANLNDQTAIRVDALWASQTAVIQGFSGVMPPDLIARASRLEEDLADLCATLGIAMPPLPVPAADAQIDPSPHPLGDIYSREIEAATREAYGRDYLLFGFGDWKKG